MPPTDPRKALAAIKQCIRDGAFIIDPVHCEMRIRQRGLDLADIKNAIFWARGIEPYADRRLQDNASSWRVHGPPLPDTKARKRIQNIAVGVHLIGDAPDSFVVVVTLFGNR